MESYLKVNPLSKTMFICINWSVNKVLHNIQGMVNKANKKYDIIISYIQGLYTYKTITNSKK